MEQNIKMNVVMNKSLSEMAIEFFVTTECDILGIKAPRFDSYKGRVKIGDIEYRRSHLNMVHQWRYNAGYNYCEHYCESCGSLLY